MTAPNWGEFEQRRREPEVEMNDLLALHARLFTTADGKEWLKRMGEIKFGTPVHPDVSDAVLRFMEGQRQMLRDIHNLTAKGLEQATRRKEAN